jgi:RecB family exonuclease
MITLHETSWSSLSAYRQCPRKWHYHYISGIKPEFEPASLRFGSGVHLACEAYYKGLMKGRTLTPFNLTRIVQNALEAPEIKFNGTSKEEHLEMAERFFQELVAKEPPPAIVGVEEERTFELAPDFRLLMKVDLLTRDADGGLVLTDFKTAAKRMNGDAASHGQMTAYSLLHPNARLRFVVFLKTKKGGIDEVYTERTDAQRAQIVRDFLEFKKEVEGPDNQFMRIPSWACKTCPFQGHCEGGCK